MTEERQPIAGRARSHRSASISPITGSFTAEGPLAAIAGENAAVHRRDAVVRSPSRAGWPHIGRERPG